MNNIPSSVEKKICPNCENVYRNHLEVCPNCGAGLQPFDYKKDQEEEKMVGWMNILTFFFPFFGIYLAVACIINKNYKGGKRILITTVVASVFWVILGILLYWCFISPVLIACTAMGI